MSLKGARRQRSPVLNSTKIWPQRLSLMRTEPTPITPVEIDGATQIWGSAPRYAQFRAPTFPSPLPCRSRCCALASLARARTSDDIRSRALCTPPQKSFARTPNLCTQPTLPRQQSVVSVVSRPGVHFGANCDLCATAYLRALRVFLGSDNDQVVGSAQGLE